MSEITTRVSAARWVERILAAVAVSACPGDPHRKSHLPLIQAQAVRLLLVSV